MPTNNWCHLDLKGGIPTAQDMICWIDWLADAGFDGLIFEYEDRLEWRSLPGTFRGSYTRQEWAAIWQRCADRSLEVVPLIQTFGHLEWLLQHKAYRHLREADLIDEICPTHPAVHDLLKAWIDDVLELHPDLRYLHLGGDEVWHMGSCGRCKAKVESAPDGRMSLYLDHLLPLLERVAARGVKPMIWADMFWPEERQPLVAKLPKDTILVDWQYGWLGPETITAGLQQGGHQVWAASAARSSYDLTMVLERLGHRIRNISIWHGQRAREAVPGVIHTCWARSSSLRPVYGPLEGWLPALLYAGDPERAAQHPLFQLVERVDMAIYSELYSDCQIAALREEIREVGSQLPHRFEQRCCQWWDLAIDYATLRHAALKAPVLQRAQDISEIYTQRDHHSQSMLRAGRAKTLSRIVDWQERGLALWREWGLSDGEEFFDSRCQALSAGL